jgi:copper chaperone
MTTIRVEGMTCGHCAQAAKRAVEAAQPGATATVDLAAGTVTVTGAADLEAVRAALRAEGYPPI